MNWQAKKVASANNHSHFFCACTIFIIQFASNIHYCNLCQCKKRCQPFLLLLLQAVLYARGDANVSNKHDVSKRVRTLKLFKLHDFPWLFPWPFQVSHDLQFSCQSKTFFVLFFALTKFNRHKLWCPPKCVPFLSCPRFVVFTFITFHNFQGPTIKFHDFPGLENEILKFHDFPGFPWPVRTLTD